MVIKKKMRWQLSGLKMMLVQFRQDKNTLKGDRKFAINSRFICLVDKLIYYEAGQDLLK